MSENENPHQPCPPDGPPSGPHPPPADSGSVDATPPTAEAPESAPLETSTAEAPESAPPETSTAEAPASASLETSTAEATASASSEMSTAEAPASTSSEKSTAVADQSAIPRRGKAFRGSVVQIADDQVFVDVGWRAQAAIPMDQFDNGRTPEPGMEVDLLITGFDESADLLRAYRQGAVVTPEMSSLLPGMLLEGNVSGMIKGGLEVQFAALRGFMPASQVDTAPMKDISVLLGQNVRCEVLELDKKKKKVIVSRRRVLKRQEDEARKTLLTELKVGQVLKGVVVSLADFGAFVDLGGLRGLVHVSDLRWTPVAKPGDVVKVGDEIEVKVLRINKDRKRISLGHKQVTPDPWSNVEQDFPVDKKLKSKIVKLAEFGAFAELADGINGLIPLSEMSWTHRPAGAAEMVEVGREVDVVVISVDAKRHRIGLSMKRLTEDPWAGVSEAFRPDAVVTGKVSKLLDFGALVELRSGVEGMVHISELSQHRVKTTGDAVQVGQEVETKVLSVDPKKRRISLTIKGVHPATSDGAAAPGADKKRQRKRPLRGGLASHFDW